MLQLQHTCRFSRVITYCVVYVHRHCSIARAFEDLNRCSFTEKDHFTSRRSSLDARRAV